MAAGKSVRGRGYDPPGGGAGAAVAVRFTGRDTGRDTARSKT